MRYPEIYKLFEGGPGPTEESARSLFVDAFEPSAAEAVVDRLQASTAPLAVAQLRVLGGATARVPDEATAFAHRRRRMVVAIGAVYESAEETAVHEAWVTDFAAALRPDDGGVCTSLPRRRGRGACPRDCPGPTWDRLAQIKHRYDPTNLFRLNQNVPPAA